MNPRDARFELDLKNIVIHGFHADKQKNKNTLLIMLWSRTVEVTKVFKKLKEIGLFENVINNILPVVDRLSNNFRI